MFDPRDDIIGLFSNSRILANSKYSSTSVFIKLLSFEDNEEKEPNDYGDKCVGILWLKQPRAVLTSIDIGFNSTEHLITVDCNLIVPKNDKWLKNKHATFMNDVLHTFETTLRANASASNKSWDTIEAANIPISIDDVNPNINYRFIEVVCKKAN